MSPLLRSPVGTISPDLTIIEGPTLAEYAWEGITTVADAGIGIIDGFVQTLNPVQSWLPIPSIGPIFGHDLAYNIGYGVGVVGGIVVNIYIGNAMGAECATASMLTRAAKIYGTGVVLVDMAHSGGNILSGNGTAEQLDPRGLDALALLGAKACFEAGTQVVVGVNADGTYATKSIEDDPGRRLRADPRPEQPRCPGGA